MVVIGVSGVHAILKAITVTLTVTLTATLVQLRTKPLYRIAVP